VIQLRVTSDTPRGLRHGHPWVYTDGLVEPTALPEPGTPVQLVDDKDRPVAFGLADKGPIAVRVLDRHPDDLWDLIHRRIHQAADARPSVLPDNTDAYRVVNGAGDALPGLVVDRYGDTSVVRLYGACWEPHLNTITHALAERDEVHTVLRRFGVRNVDGRAGAERLSGPPADEPLVVSEAGAKFLARPTTGQKTGLFLDQRDNRIQIARWCAGKNVANLFGYTGGFSVHAALAGAKRVITVDQSAPALADAEENFRLNDLDPAAHAFIATDIFKWEIPETQAVLIVDPPSLSRGQRSDQPAKKAYRDLATRTGAMVAPGGLLATASCTARVSWERWEEAIRDGISKTGRWSWVWRTAQPGDHPVALGHPEGHYLKFAVLRRHQPRF
jgi:23S rRNA (cytosine1962-C5)-methyltransferase